MEGSRSYSFSVDVYSYGIILWELLTREEPFNEVISAFQLPVKVVGGLRYRIPTTIIAQRSLLAFPSGLLFLPTAHLHMPN